MEFVIVALTALVASALTLYSGFGLGALLLPAFALFFPAPAAVAATALVHLLNNLFKGALVAARAQWRLVALFAVTAIPAAVAGALLLGKLGAMPRLYEWSFRADVFGSTPASVVIGALMIVFALLEIAPWFRRIAAPVSGSLRWAGFSAAFLRADRPARRLALHVSDQGRP